MERCRLCGEPKKLIQAHVIPEAFFREMRAGDGAPPLLVKAGEYPRRAPIGVYDQTILCADCERRFGDLDAFGARVLLQDFRSLFTPMPGPTGGAAGYQSASIDARMLLRFLIATLWRASVSTQPFYGRINLGAHEKAAEQLALEDKDDGGVFDAVLARWPAATDVGIASHPMLDPHRHRFDGVNAYRLYLGETVAEIKVDRRPFPPGMAQLGLRAAPPVRAVVRGFTNSKDLAAMVRTANGALNPRRRSP